MNIEESIRPFEEAEEGLSDEPGEPQPDEPAPEEQ